MDELISADYARFLDEIKQQVQVARTRAALAANRELVELYWRVGQQILSRQSSLWGAKVVERLSRDLRAEFPELKGFSTRNLKYMRLFAEKLSDLTTVQQVVALLPWGHVVRLLDAFREPETIHFYAERALAEGWSRSTLIRHVQTGLHLRAGQAPTNFSQTLPATTAAAARQVLKDPYVFDFLNVGEEAHERDVEQAMVAHIRDTLLELGVGFAFVGRQVPMRVGDEEYFIDLLFYHLRLRCYVVVELKGERFKPEHMGQVGFYLAAADDVIRNPDHDGPTIGLLICRSHNKVVVEYALRTAQQPIGVAAMELTRRLPAEWGDSLPTIEALEAELAGLGQEGED